MSDTPETDALVPQFLKGGEVPDIFAHCRKLEQERDEARKEAEYYKERYEQLKDERDEAREELKNEMKWHHQTHKELVEAQCKLLDIEYDKLKS